MANHKSQRDQLREKRLRRQKSQIRTILIILGALFLFILALVFLPRLLVSKETLTNQEGFSIGDPNAPVYVEEFSDFQCSHCKTFSQTIEPDFIKEYVDTGKVYLTFKNFPIFGQESENAAESTYCAADQNNMWQYKKALFNFSSFQDAFSNNNLISYAKQLDLDSEEFQACLESDKYLSAVQADMEYGKNLGIQGTPSFSVNGTIVYSNELVSTVESELLNLSTE